MKFYNRYPMMRPYVGKNFHGAGTPSLLLIGESHYLDGDCPQRRSESWYSGSFTDLSDDQVTYIDNVRLLENSRAEGFSKKSHVIFKNAFSEINEYGPRYSDYKLVADDIAFYNFFLRPGLEGDSLEVTDQDVALANEAFLLHYEALKPTAVVFLSRLAHENFNPAEPIGTPIISTAHPGCQWWNRVAHKYGDRRGRDVLADFIRTTQWRDYSMAQPN
jgi:hypothetical protein